jgi:hypothetical protein
MESGGNVEPTSASFHSAASIQNLSKSVFQQEFKTSLLHPSLIKIDSDYSLRVKDIASSTKGNYELKL